MSNAPGYQGYRVIILKRAEKTILGLPKPAREAITKKIDLLISNPESLDIKKMQGKHILPVFRIRAGDYRIIYAVNKATRTLAITVVGHRKDVYTHMDCLPITIH